MRSIRIVAILSFIVVLWSCQKDDAPPSYVGQYLKTYKKVKSYSKEETQGKFYFAALQYPEFGSLAEDIKSGVTVYSIEYKSKDYNDNPILLSGIVAAPNSMDQDVLLMSFQNGTIVEHAEAPSVDINNPLFLLLHSAAGMGMTICIPDYIGFGSSSNLMHPYLSKQSFQNSIIDMIKAVDEMDQQDILPADLNGDLYLSGYSLGGWASFVAHKEIEDSPIQGFNLLGSSCGAGSYDLIQMKNYLFNATDFVQPFYVPYLITGLQSVGEIPNDMSLYFNSPYDQVIPTLFDGQHSSGQINSQLTKNMQELLTIELREDFDTDPNYSLLKQALINNSQAAWVNKKPLHLYHGTDDIHVPYYISENTYNDFVSLGLSIEKVTFTPLEGKDHSTGVIDMYIKVLDDITDIIQ